MSSLMEGVAGRSTSYGESRLSPVDHLGVYLSKRAIFNAIGDRTGLEVLDLGCGYHATLLNSLGSRVRSGVGVDLVLGDAVKSSPSIEGIESTVEDVLPKLADRAFDLILLISVLEHLREADAALRAIHDLLKPGGTALINVPTWWGKGFLEFSAFRLGLSPAVEMDDHKMYYAKRDLWPMLVRAGFLPSRLRLSYHKFGMNLFAIASR